MLFELVEVQLLMCILNHLFRGDGQVAVLEKVQNWIGEVDPSI